MSGYVELDVWASTPREQELERRLTALRDALREVVPSGYRLVRTRQVPRRLR